VLIQVYPLTYDYSVIINKLRLNSDAFTTTGLPMSIEYNCHLPFTFYTTLTCVCDVAMSVSSSLPLLLSSSSCNCRQVTVAAKGQITPTRLAIFSTVDSIFVSKLTSYRPQERLSYIQEYQICTERSINRNPQPVLTKIVKFNLTTIFVFRYSF
jgi:hypothetical protein